MNSSFSDTMQEVLNAPKYAYLTGRYESLGKAISNFINKIINFLAELFNLRFSDFGQAINADMLSALFMVIAIVALVGVIAFVTYFYKKRKQGHSAFDDIFDEYRSNKLSLDEIMSLAKKSHNEGDYRQAVRYRYIGLVMLFNELEIVKVNDSMTGGQFVREVYQKSPSLGQSLANTVEMYYLMFFGNKPAHMENYKNHVEIYNAMVKEAGLFEK